MWSVNILTDIDLPALPKVSEAMVLRLLSASAKMGGELIRQAWEARAVALNVRHTGSYLRGIRSEARITIEEERETGPDTYEVVVAVTNTSQHASIVEEGHAAFHLPAKIDWSSADGKIKRSKDGRLYLVIPFRHAAFVPPDERAARGMTAHARRSMLPREVYAEAKRLDYSTPLREGPIAETRVSAGGIHQGGQEVPRGQSYSQHLAADRYRWARGEQGALRRPLSFHRPGQTIGGQEPWVETRGARGENPAWKGSKFEGLRRMGGPRHTQYLTFRVVTPASEGWHIPAQAGKWIAAQVAETAPAMVGPFVEETFHQLLEERGLL